MKEKIVFRVDGGKVWGIGYGHLRRALLLAKQLKQLYKVYFIMKNYHEGVEYVRKSGFEVIEINKEDDGDEFLIDIIDCLRPKSMIFDLNEINYSTIFCEIKNRHIKTIVFCQKDFYNEHVDVVINEMSFKKCIRDKKANSGPKIYSGLDFFIIDSNIKAKKTNKKVRNILVTFGGSDPSNTTIKVADTLCNWTEITKYNLNLVIGPLNTDADYLKSLYVTKSSVCIYDNPKDFLSLLSEQDIVITAGGRTLFECAYLGVPAIVLPTNEREFIIAEQVCNYTRATNLGLWYENTPYRLIQTVEEYTTNYVKRLTISNLSLKLIDGNGLKRTLKIILEGLSE